MIGWTLGYWVLVYAVLTLRALVIPYDALWAQAGLRLAMMPVGLLICAALFLILAKVDARPLERKLLPVLAGIAAATFLYSTVNYILFYVVTNLWEPRMGPFAAIGFYSYQFIWIFAGWVGLYFYVRSRLIRQARRDPYARELWARHLGKDVRIPVGEIDWMESEKDYVRIHRDDRSFLIRSTLRKMEEMLDPEQFVRIHRRLIVAREAIAALKRRPGGRIEIDLATGERLPVGRSYAARVKQKGAEREAAKG
ncbi:MAG: LytTR family DNA-binding domain-containing protein [Sphingomonadaceae bacterium]